MMSFRPYLCLAAVCGAVFFFNLGAAHLFDEDEPKNAECGREMFERGDWLVPTYNYDLRTDKPIMLYWLMLGSFNTFGVSEFSARLPSALMSTLTIFSVFLIGRRLFDQRTGFWSAVILASSLMFVTASRISTPDATLISWITLAFLIFVYAVPIKIWQADSSDMPTHFTLPQFWWQFALMYAVMGLAVLTKGPVGFLLPCAVIGLFLLVQKDAPHLPQGLHWRRPLTSLNELLEYSASFWEPTRFARALWAMRPLTLAVVVSAVALPWYVAVSWATDGAWLAGFLGNHNVGRFSSAMEGHSGPFFYYVIAIAAGFFPWSVFLPISLYLASTLKNAFPTQRRGLIFLLAWAGLYVVFFSIAQTKLPNYVLPCYPPLALLTGWVLVNWQAGRLEMPAWAIQYGPLSLMAVGVTLAIAFPIVGFLLLPGYASLGVIGLIPLLCGLYLWRNISSINRDRLLPIMGAGSLTLAVAALAVAAPWISRAQESSQLGLQAARLSDNQTPLATYRYFTTNLPFYAQRPVIRYHQPDEVRDFFTQHPSGLLCVRDEDFTKLAAELPDTVQVIEQTARFLRPGHVLMLRQVSPAQLAQQKAAEKNEPPTQSADRTDETSETKIR